MRGEKISSGIFYYLYITTNAGKTVLYTGMTNDLKRRMFEHYSQQGETKHFASKYHCYKLIYYEIYETALDVIQREKEVKNMIPAKKLDLVRSKDPKLNFLII